MMLGTLTLRNRGRLRQYMGIGVKKLVGVVFHHHTWCLSVYIKYLAREVATYIELSIQAL